MISGGCQSCGTVLTGDFCHHCGEQRLEAGQRKLKVLFGHFLEELTSLDSKLLRTLKAFLLHPGLLSERHWQGVRKPYVKPVTLFLLINVLYFFTTSLTDFALPLSNQPSQPYGALLKPVIDDYLAATGHALADVSARYDAMSQLVAKSIIVVSIPFLVPFIWLVNPVRRFYMLDHSVFAIHIYSFVLLWPVILTTLSAALTYVGLASYMPGWLLSLFIWVPFFAYIVAAQKTMYADRLWVSALKALVIFAGIVISHFIYRFVQFWLVWWQVT